MNNKHGPPTTSTAFATFATFATVATKNEQRTTNNEQRTTNNEQRTTNNEQRTTNERTTNNEQRTNERTNETNERTNERMFADQRQRNGFLPRTACTVYYNDIDCNGIINDCIVDAMPWQSDAVHRHQRKATTGQFSRRELRKRHWTPL